MGIGSKVIEKGIEEVGKTIRKPENTEQSIELGEPSSKPTPISKLMVILVLLTILISGFVMLWNKPLRFNMYIEFIKAFLPYFGIFTSVVAGGRAFKNYLKKEKL